VIRHDKCTSKLFNFPGSHGFDGLAFPTFINWAFDDRFHFGIKGFSCCSSSGLDRPEIMNGFVMGRRVDEPLSPSLTQTSPIEPLRNEVEQRGKKSGTKWRISNCGLFRNPFRPRDKKSGMYGVSRDGPIVYQS